MRSVIPENLPLLVRISATDWVDGGWDLEQSIALSGLLKGAVFGLIVALSGCWFGMNAGRGAAGVGRATKYAVVAAAVGIFAANFVMTGLFFA